jgi:hypothetical protein
MGTTVPSGMVVVAGPADKLICCWPNPATAAKRRNTLNIAAAFTVGVHLVAVHLQSLIRIIVVASRSHCILDMEFVFAAARPG